nr:dockerin type I domain-containing protein [Pirellulaceae bacterium]
PPLVDVNDDGFVAPIDALRVVNYINLGNGEGEAEGEGEGEEALMMSYGVTQVTVSSASIADLVEPVASSVLVDSPVIASPERVRESQFAELDLSRKSSLDAVLADIGGEVSDLRDISDGHDEFFASIQY